MSCWNKRNNVWLFGGEICREWIFHPRLEINFIYFYLKGVLLKLSWGLCAGHKASLRLYARDIMGWQSWVSHRWVGVERQAQIKVLIDIWHRLSGRCWWTLTGRTWALGWITFEDEPPTPSRFRIRFLCSDSQGPQSAQKIKWKVSMAVCHWTSDTLSNIAMLFKQVLCLWDKD